MRTTGRRDAAIAALFGYSPRRVRQLVTLVRLPGPVQDLVELYALDEKRLRHLLPWRHCAHFPTLVEWVGRNRLTAEQVRGWSKLLKSPAACTESLPSEARGAGLKLARILAPRT